MKTPTYPELVNLRAALTVNFIRSKVTKREQLLTFAAIGRWMSALRHKSKFVLHVPGTGAIWFYQTEAEGEKHRAWLIKNIDLTPACRVVAKA